MARKPTTKDLFDKIESQKGKIPVIGVVMTDDINDQSLKFSPHVNCNNWLSIPISMIDDIDFIQTVSCNDHSHPLVRLTLKEPSSDEAKLFASLVKEFHATSLQSTGATADMIATSFSRLEHPTGSFFSYGHSPDTSHFAGPAMANVSGRLMSGFGTICGWVTDASTGKRVYRCF